jgi:hypothetical protein
MFDRNVAEIERWGAVDLSLLVKLNELPSRRGGFVRLALRPLREQ